MTQPSGFVAVTLALLAVLALNTCGSEPSSSPSEPSTERGPQPSTAPAPATSRTTTATASADTTPATPTPPSTTASPPSPTWIRAESAATPDEALSSWFAANETPYVGDCGTAPPDAVVGSWCTSPFRAEDDRRIYRAGQVRSEYATWLLMTRAAGQWTIVDVASGGDPAAVPWP